MRSTTFDYLNNVLYEKEFELLKNGQSEFVPFMIQRWASMVSPEMAYVVNETSNTYFSSMEDKQMWYDFFVGMYPKVPKTRISYMKKNKVKPSEDVKKLAQRLEISFREAEELVEIDQELNKKEKTVEVFKKSN